MLGGVELPLTLRDADKQVVCGGASHCLAYPFMTGIMSNANNAAMRIVGKEVWKSELSFA